MLNILYTMSYILYIMLGILSPDDVMDGDDEDEILTELKQKQQELRTIGQHNLSMTKRLYR